MPLGACEKLDAELVLLHGLINQTLPEVRKVISMDTFIIFFKNDEMMSTLVPNVKKLLKLYLLAPMSIAGGERTFSVMKRVKSDIRSTMTNKRTNNLMLIHTYSTCRKLQRNLSIQMQEDFIILENFELSFIVVLKLCNV